jgi:hypothetical protein
VKSHWVWKLLAVLLSIVAAGDLVSAAIEPDGLLYRAGSAGLAFAAVGSVQYAFGWPRTPRNVWRVFGTLFSTVMIWPLASSVGWLATRLAIKRLTLAEQASTAGLLILLAVYALAVVVPLYRLGDWGDRKSKTDDEALAELTDTFA